MFKLTDKQKAEMKEVLRTTLKGTPGQPHQSLLVELLFPTICGWVERRDEVFKQDNAS